MSDTRPPADETLAEFTLKAVIAGVVLGCVFGAANAYIGVKAGMTVSASIPAAVMTVAVFRLFRLKSTILEANLAQTIGSASTALATGAVFTIPALFLWGAAPPYLQVVALCFLGGVLGLSAMIPLRRLLIVREHATLPYPEGTACAEVLRATSSNAGGSHWIFLGMALGVGIKLLLAVVSLVPGEVDWAVPGLPKAQLGIELSPMLIAVGFLLGYRQSGILVAGGVISALVLTPLIAFFGENLAAPLYPEMVKRIAEMDSGAIWSRYVRYIGAGAVATAGILTLARNLPSMIEALTRVVAGLKRGGDAAAGAPRTDRDLPGWFVILGVGTVVLVSGFVPGIFAGEMGLGPRLLCAAGVGVFGVLFVTVAARIVGIVGVSSQPTSGIALVTLLGTASIFAALGWVDPGARAAVITVGTIVAIAASKAGDISQDLKTGWLVGATPARQQLGQLIGASFACWAVAATVLLIGHSYEFGTKEAPAPQGVLMKTIVEGVLHGNLPWGLVLSGAGLSLGAMLCGVSGLAFAIGVYLPLATMMPIFVGGCVRGLVERGRVARSAAEKDSDPGVLAASGIVAGEGLAGVLVAALVGAGKLSKNPAPLLSGLIGEIGTLTLVFLACLFLWRAARSRVAD